MTFSGLRSRWTTARAGAEHDAVSSHLLILANGRVWTGDGVADRGAAGGIDLRGRQQIALTLECSGARSRAPAAEAAAATRAGSCEPYCDHRARKNLRCEGRFHDLRRPNDLRTEELMRTTIIALLSLV